MRDVAQVGQFVSTELLIFSNFFSTVAYNDVAYKKKIVQLVAQLKTVIYPFLCTQGHKVATAPTLSLYKVPLFVIVMPFLNDVTSRSRSAISLAAHGRQKNNKMTMYCYNVLI